MKPSTENSPSESSEGSKIEVNMLNPVNMFHQVHAKIVMCFNATYLHSLIHVLIATNLNWLCLGDGFILVVRTYCSSFIFNNHIAHAYMTSWSFPSSIFNNYTHSSNLRLYVHIKLWTFWTTFENSSLEKWHARQSNLAFNVGGQIYDLSEYIFMISIVNFRFRHYIKRYMFVALF